MTGQLKSMFPDGKNEDKGVIPITRGRKKPPLRERLANLLHNATTQQMAALGVVIGLVWWQHKHEITAAQRGTPAKTEQTPASVADTARKDSVTAPAPR